QVGLTQNYPIRGQNILVYMYIVLIAGRMRRKYAIKHGSRKKRTKVQIVSGFSQVAKLNAFRCASSKAKARRL
ncbi:MAG: hypothetical protein LBT59_02605, partial [Clostridiales bacterium]|nr:hypothetical protein [Clostridiales bacterium]